MTLGHWSSTASGTQRDEQLAEVGLDVDGITAAAALELAKTTGLPGVAAGNGRWAV